MHRRHFITSTVGATLMAASSSAHAQTTASGGRTPDVYLWRQYVLRTGTQLGRLADFLQKAPTPPPNRPGPPPTRGFEVTFGLPTPTVFVLTPSSSIDNLMSIEA